MNASIPRDQLPNRRFFLTGTPPESLPATVSLTDAHSVAHARTVLRMQVGNPVIAVDPETRSGYRATIIGLGKTALVLELIEKLALPPDTTPAGWLGVAMVKEQRWDWLLQKATELGMGRLTPLATERTIVHVGDPAKKQERWQAIAQAAAGQSEGLFIPPVDLPNTLTDFLDQTQAVPCRWLLQEDGEDRIPLHRAISQLGRSALVPVSAIQWSALIGPEGGWTAPERQQIIAAGFTPVALGKRILKTETAVMALLSAVMLSANYSS